MIIIIDSVPLRIELNVLIGTKKEVIPQKIRNPGKM